MSRHKKIPKRSRRLFTSTQDKEAKFIACLLANGPPPTHSRRGTYDVPGMATNPDYQTQVMDWWRSCHTSEPAITNKGVHRFYNRYKRWLANEKYRQRRADKYDPERPHTLERFCKDA